MKKILLPLLLMISFFAKAQVVPQWQALPNGIKMYYPGKIPSGFDSLYSYTYLKNIFLKKVDTASLSDRIDAKIPLTEKGAANGVPTLDGGGKVPLSQLPANLLIYKGQWNPATNTPTLINGTGTTGDVWEASVDGDHDFGAGTLHFLQGDFAIYNGSSWQLSAGVNRVTSVEINGKGAQQGIVNFTLTTSDITEGTNKYYTDARVQAFGDPRYVLKAGDTMTGNLTIQDYNLIVHNVGHGASVIDGSLNVGSLTSTGRVSAADFYTSSNYTRISDTEAQLTQIRLLNKTTLADPNVLVLNHSAFTASRTQTFQDKDGAIALTSDIPGISGTANLVARFTGTNTLGTGVLNDDATVAAARGTTAGIAGFIITNPGTSTGYVNGAALQFNYASGLTTSALRIARIVAAPQTGGGGDLYFDTAPSSTGTWNTRMVLLQAGRMGLGTTAPNAFAEFLSTSEQLRLSYNATIYTSFSTSSFGNFTIAPTGGHIGLGVAQAATTLNNTLNLTGNTTAYGINSLGVIQSDVTSNAYYNNITASTAAIAFTLTNLYYNNAIQGTFGAGSSVTNQYGFSVSSTLIGAANNYGFFGNIPSGSGRWNFYAAGTASNYLAGTLGVGTNSIAANIHSQSTTEQLRLGYDATHYTSYTVNSAGNITVAPTGGSTPAFTVNSQTGGSTGDLADFALAGVTKASINKDGLFSGLGFANTTSNNAYFQAASTGAIISRNVADANTALIVNQAAAAATGNIQQWQFNSSEVAHLEKDGTFVSNANIHASGNIEVSSHVEGNQFILTALNTAPASSSDTGTTGEIKVTAGYIYVCVATNTWVRTALSTF